MKRIILLMAVFLGFSIGAYAEKVCVNYLEDGSVVPIFWTNDKSFDAGVASERTRLGYDSLDYEIIDSSLLPDTDYVNVWKGSCSGNCNGNYNANGNNVWLSQSDKDQLDTTAALQKLVDAEKISLERETAIQSLKDKGVIASDRDCSDLVSNGISESILGTEANDYAMAIIFPEEAEDIEKVVKLDEE